MQLQLVVAKVWRLSKRVPAQAASDWSAAFFNDGQAVALALAAYTSWVALQTANIPTVIAEAGSWINALVAISYVSIGWGVVCFLRAPFKVYDKEQQVGHWDKHHFVYETPEVVFVARIESQNGATQKFRIEFKDAEPSCFASCTMLSTPSVIGRVAVMLQPGEPMDEIQYVEPEPNQVTLWGRPDGVYRGIRLNEGKVATLYVRVTPNTIPTVLRVYCDQFYLGRNGEAYSPL